MVNDILQKLVLICRATSRLALASTMEPLEIFSGGKESGKILISQYRNPLMHGDLILVSSQKMPHAVRW